MPIEFWMSVIGVGGAVLGYIITPLMGMVRNKLTDEASAHKTNIDADVQIINEYMKLINAVQLRVDIQDKRIAVQDKEIEALKKQNTALHMENIQLREENSKLRLRVEHLEKSLNKSGA